MAGVGFELRRLMRRRSFAAIGASFLYGSALSAGPWLVTVVAMVLLMVWARPLLGTTTFALFATTIMYAFCGSLIVSGPWVMVSTRYAADQIFLRRRDRIPAGVHAAMASTAAACLLVGCCVAIVNPWRGSEGQALAYRWLVGGLFLCLSLVWVVFGTMSYVRWYRWALASFLLGGAVSLGGALLLGRSDGLTGAMAGYAAGFVVLLGCLYALWRLRYHRGAFWDNGVFGHFARLMPIAGVGFLYQLGVWADKFVFWWRCGQAVGQTPLRSVPHYDVLTFLAYISMVPAMSYFLIVVETQFFERYRTYLVRVRSGTLQTVRESEAELRRSMRRGLWLMAECQLVITLSLVVAADWILGVVGLSGWPVGMFRWLLLAAACQVMLLTAVVLLLYFELRWEAFGVTAFFCAANALCTAWSTAWPVDQWGAGYCMATASAFLIGAGLLELRVRRITFLIFARQPIVDA